MGFRALRTAWLRIGLWLVVVLGVLMLHRGTAAAQLRCPASITGTLSAASSSQTGRLKNGTASACGTSKVVPVIQSPAATFHYATASLQNRSRSAACVTITLTVTAGSAQSAVYSGAFDPANPQTGYLADSGAAASGGAVSYGVTIPALSTFTVTVNATSAANVSYALDVTGCGAVVLTQVTPNAGPTAGGTNVTLSGSGFLPGPQVTFGGAPATKILLVDQGTITATTPAGAAGATNVVVTNADATTSTLVAGYTYNPPAATTVTLASSKNPSVFGQSVTFTAKVTSAAGTPTGSVAFVDGGAVLATVALNASGAATYTTSSLAVATHPITAQYAGTPLFAAGKSSTVSQIVNHGPTSTKLAASPDPSDFGDTVTFTATVAAVSPATGTPAGSVTFTVDGASIGAAPLDAAGTASVQSSALVGGNHDVVASYAGSSNHAASTSATLVQSVSLLATSTTLAASASESILGSPLTLTATVTPAAGKTTPTGNVTFSESGAQIGVAVLDAKGTATLVVDSLLLGTHSLVATYDADTAFATSTSAPVSVVVSVGDAGIAIEAGASVVDSGAAAAVDSGAGLERADASAVSDLGDAGDDFTYQYVSSGGGCSCRSAQGADVDVSGIVVAIAALSLLRRRKVTSAAR